MAQKHTESDTHRDNMGTAEGKAYGTLQLLRYQWQLYGHQQILQENQKTHVQMDEQAKQEEKLELAGF